MPTSQNNKYKNIIHSQKLLLSNKDETISLLNERIAKLETQKELNELKQRIGELKKQNKEFQKYKQDYETLQKEHKTTSKRLSSAQEMNLRNYAEIRKYKKCISEASRIINEAEKITTYLAKECGTYKNACDNFLDFKIMIKHDPDEYSDEFIKLMNEKIEELTE